MFIRFLQKNHWIFFIIPLVLLIPALLINLGLLPFILDESTRGQVALEMIITGNYITPTINGEFYINKPPLYNWLIIAFIKLFNSKSEFVLRLPMVFSLLSFGITIFFSLAKKYGRQFALIVALMVVTSGRIFFYDSFRGLIDITFSWIVYSSFIAIYHFFQKKKWWTLFILSYLLTTIGFMLKGLPALVFQAITLLAYFIYKKEWKRLFTMSHVIGLLVFILLVSLYFYCFSKHYPLREYISNLWLESSKRTAIENTFVSTVTHILTFPGEFLLHFLPWSLLFICVFRKGVLKQIHTESFIQYCFIIFLANIIIYWISPAIYARYLFMFLPLFFTVLLYICYLKGLSVHKKIIFNAFFAMSIGITILFAVVPFIDQFSDVPNLFYKISFLIIFAVLFIWLSIRIEQVRLLLFISILILSRIGFDWFVVTDRYKEGNDLIRKQGPIEIGQITKGEDLYIFGDSKIHNVESFYITRERMEILTRKHEDLTDGSYYIMENDSISNSGKYSYIYEKNLGKLKLVKFNP